MTSNGASIDISEVVIDDPISLEQAQEILSLTKDSLMIYADSGKIKARRTRLNKRYVYTFSESDVLAYRAKRNTKISESSHAMASRPRKSRKGTDKNKSTMTHYHQNNDLADPISLEEACQQTGLTEASIKRYGHDGKFAMMLRDHCYYVSQGSINEYLATRNIQRFEQARHAASQAYKKPKDIQKMTEQQKVSSSPSQTRTRQLLSEPQVSFREYLANGGTMEIPKQEEPPYQAMPQTSLASSLYEPVASLQQKESYQQQNEMLIDTEQLRTPSIAGYTPVPYEESSEQDEDLFHEAMQLVRAQFTEQGMSIRFRRIEERLSKMRFWEYEVETRVRSIETGDIIPQTTVVHVLHTGAKPIVISKTYQNHLKQVIHEQSGIIADLRKELERYKPNGRFETLSGYTDPVEVYVDERAGYCLITLREANLCAGGLGYTYAEAEMLFRASYKTRCLILQQEKAKGVLPAHLEKQLIQMEFNLGIA